MKTIFSTLALALALAFSGPAFAAEPVATAKTKDDCQKAGGVWNAGTNTCSAPVGNVPSSESEQKK
jgi:uncharacterized membrane protein